MLAIPNILNFDSYVLGEIAQHVSIADRASLRATCRQLRNILPPPPVNLLDADCAFIRALYKNNIHLAQALVRADPSVMHYINTSMTVEYILSRGSGGAEMMRALAPYGIIEIATRKMITTIARDNWPSAEYNQFAQDFAITTNDIVPYWRINVCNYRSYNFRAWSCYQLNYFFSRCDDRTLIDVYARRNIRGFNTELAILYNIGLRRIYDQLSTHINEPGEMISWIELGRGIIDSKDENIDQVLRAFEYNFKHSRSYGNAHITNNMMRLLHKRYAPLYTILYNVKIKQHIDPRISLCKHFARINGCDDELVALAYSSYSFAQTLRTYLIKKYKVYAYQFSNDTIQDIISQWDIGYAHKFAHIRANLSAARRACDYVNVSLKQFSSLKYRLSEIYNKIDKLESYDKPSTNYLYYARMAIAMFTYSGDEANDLLARLIAQKMKYDELIDYLINN